MSIVDALGGENYIMFKDKQILVKAALDILPNSEALLIISCS